MLRSGTYKGKMKFQEDNKHSQKRLHGRETFEFSP